MLESAPLVHDWRASAAEMLERFFGDDEGAKCAVAANVAYYADDARNLAWPFFAVAQGGLPQVGRRVHQGRLARAVDEARQGRHGRGRVGPARPRGDGRRPRRLGPPSAVRHVDARSKDDEQRVEAKQVLANCAPHVLAPMLPDAERAKIDEAYGGRPLSTRCSPPISG